MAIRRYKVEALDYRTKWMWFSGFSVVFRWSSSFLEEVLDLYLFGSLAEARAITEEWPEEYNAIRPHEALGGLSPYQYAATADH